MTRRTDAFTLQELLIVMILSGILLSTAYYGLRVVQQYYLRFDQRSEQNLAHQTLHSLLQRDFERAVYVVKEERAVVCHLNSEPIIYKFTTEAVLRRQAGAMDSFPGPAQELRCFFLSDEVAMPGQPISELTFTITSQEEFLPYRVHKTYAADVLMHLTSPAWPD